MAELPFSRDRLQEIERAFKELGVNRARDSRGKTLTAFTPCTLLQPVDTVYRSHSCCSEVLDAQLESGS
ncbi:hypothetical protein NNJEOMEG_02634 [Fundidesulfovibrio magnetotacticus]|uniref:Uncharacterized protein n=1 Tax=Fundidesulfovibrio magnetotacticus TaxID=2730080 RepID=A0A6V8LYA0_9BACT|nr:hypothetical protein [Fundidesulfovibrio magnetotacticus]GFK94786.1 hypothetical protein NNJEOMEG_02634 [Fundidesulfovibrio magnetotacticus]